MACRRVLITPELNAISPDGFEYSIVDEEFVVGRDKTDYNFYKCLQSQLKCFLFITIFHHNMFQPLWAIFRWNIS
jgi:hypothetical protein